MGPPRCHAGEQAMIVLRRPGPGGDQRGGLVIIFGLVRQATVGREVAPGRSTCRESGRNPGGDGARGPAGPCADTSRHTRVSRRVPAGRRQPRQDLFAGGVDSAHIRQGRPGGIHLDDAGEETKVIDVAGPGRTMRSPGAVNARSSRTRSRRTPPGPVTLLPGPQRTSRPRACGMRPARVPVRQRAGLEARQGSTGCDTRAD